MLIIRQLIQKKKHVILKEIKSYMKRLESRKNFKLVMIKKWREIIRNLQVILEIEELKLDNTMEVNGP